MWAMLVVVVRKIIPMHLVHNFAVAGVIEYTRRDPWLEA